MHLGALSLIQVALVLCSAWILLGYITVRIIRAIRGLPPLDDGVWLVPSLSAIEIVLSVGSLPRAWKCLGSSSCLDDPAELCVYFVAALLLVIFLGGKEINRIVRKGMEEGRLKE
jgi:hypothetical protein